MMDIVYKSLQKPFSCHSLLQQSLVALLSGGLLSLSYLNSDFYVFAWFAFVPLLMVIERTGLQRTYWLGMFFGIGFYTSAAYWVVDFLMLSKGYGVATSILWAIIFWLYCSQLPALVALIFNLLKRRASVHEFLLFPLVVVTLYSLFPMLFSVQLGESQSRFLSAIQATEFFGVYGLDAMIALSNIVIFRLVLPLPKVSPTQIKQSNMAYLLSAYFLSALVFTLWFVYGVYANWNWEEKIEHWGTVRIGIVQPNEAPSLEYLKVYPGYSRAYPPEMEMTKRLVSAGAKLTVWPEARYKAYYDQPHVRAAYKDVLSKLNSHLLFQDIERVQESNQEHSYRQFNVAGMINSKGELIGHYQKIKRVAFGEYVPLVSDFPSVRGIVEGFFGKFLNEMDKGSSYQSFKADDLRIIPLICYETMFPEFVAGAVKKAVLDSLDSSSAESNILVGLSSNGWFGTTVQPYQHVNASVLRAVENRLPLVHAVNNGPSVIVQPNGKIIFKSDYHQAGGYLVDIPHSKTNQGSFFSRHPTLFIYSVYGLLLMLMLVSLFRGKVYFFDHNKIP